MFLRKLFRNKLLNNQKGSTLTITLAVIAVLSFSVVSVTRLTVNLSNATSQHMQAANDEALGKALITKAISDMQLYITTEGSYDGFDTSVKPLIEDELGVGILNSTEFFDGFGDNGNVHSRIYKFSYAMTNGQTLFKYSYISAFGTTVDTPNPFSFSMGTDADLILNGGYYSNVDLYGKNIYLSDIAMYEEATTSGGRWNPVTTISYEVTNPNLYNFPDFTSGDEDTSVYYRNEYQYCTYGCYEAPDTTDEPFTMREDLFFNVNGSTYGEPGDVVDNNISQFFSSFILSDYLLEYGLNILPTNDMQIDDASINLDNFPVRITEYAGEPTTGGGNSGNYYENYTDYALYNPQNNDTTLTKGILWEGDELIISRDHIFTETQQYGMVVVGDLTIDNTQRAGGWAWGLFSRLLSLGNPITISGTYIVTGDLTVKGYDVNFDNCTFIVMGGASFEFEDGRGFQTFGAYEDFAIIAGDNVVFKNVWEGISLDRLFTTFIPTKMMIYTDESIWIDAVESKLSFQGALYAKGTGDSENPIPLVNSTGHQINGIVINSYKSVQSSNDFWDFFNPFRLEALPENEFDNYFDNIPVLENVTVSESVFTVDLGEWQKE
jgi:hypothetical protein